MILSLMGDVVPSIHNSSLKEIIQLNEIKMEEMLSKVLRPSSGELEVEEAGGDEIKLEKEAESFFKTQDLDKMMKDEKEEEAQNDLNKKRLSFLKFMISFRAKEHIEMLNLPKFREIVNVEGLKILLSKSRFVNYTIQEKQSNILLGLQGYYLKNFIYFHMKADMRFKATIDSSTIDMDNPYTRNTIREENKKDPTLSEKYIKTLNVESLCLSLLDRFFPDIAGIWCDHSHFMPYYIIEFIKICFEYGFISPPVAKQILFSLSKKAVSLIKLEEGWMERLNEVKLLSDMIKANNITSLFAKCRENLAYLLLQIIVLLNDDTFIREFPRLVSSRKIDAILPNIGQKGEDEKEDARISELMEKEFCFFDKEVNDSLLFITMNYLSNTVYISLQKGMNPESKAAVERVFLFVTTTNRDAFLNSLKQVKSEDLKYFNETDVVSKDIRDTCDDLGNTMRKLIELISLNVFERQRGVKSKKFEEDKSYIDFLKQHVPIDNPTLQNIISRILSFIEENCRKSEDFAAGLVKESVPLALIALIDYITEYFGPEVRQINREIFSTLTQLCKNNNYCKAQLFKGDGLYHLKKLLNRPDKDTFLFINKLCNEDNIAFFLGRDLFSELMTILEKYNRIIIAEVFGDKSGIDKFTLRKEASSASLREHFNFVESSAIFILMNKIVTKIFQKQFLNEREKLQSALMAQEVLYSGLCKHYLPRMLQILSDKTLKMENTQEKLLNKRIFMNDSESELVQKLEEVNENMNETHKKIILLNVCFSVLRAFNMVCNDCYSSIVYKDVVDNILGKPLEEAGVGKDDRKLDLNDDDDTDNETEEQNSRRNTEPDTVYDYLAIPQRNRLRAVEPFGLETELVTLVRLFMVYPDEHCMIETKFNTKTSLEKTDRRFLRRCIRKITYFASQRSDQEEAQNYLLEGLFPLIYRILKGLRNLSNFDKQQNITYNLEQIKYIMKKLNGHILKFNTIIGHEVFDEDVFTVNNKSTNDKIEKPLRKRKPSLLNDNSANGSKDEKKKSSDSSTRQRRLVDACDFVIDFISAYFEETADSHPGLLRRFKDGQDISNEDFQKMVYAAKFEEKTNFAEIQNKKELLNKYIKSYQTFKEDYFERDEEPNLMSYFDRNEQNLRGVFNSCIDRLLSRSKIERRSTIAKSLSKDYAISRFWLNPPCYAYINMLQRLLTKSKTARKGLYTFLKEDIAEQKAEKEEKKADEDEGQLSGINQLSRPRNNLISVLIRIHTDLLVFLNSNASLTPLWWITHEIYEMINGLIQNLCECNFMEFKEYLGEFRPFFKDEGWENLKGKSVMEILVGQLIYLNTSCRISKNKEPVMVHSDMIQKMKPLMGPLLSVINEAITGPCAANQKVLMEMQLDKLINISMRVIDELDSDYHDLADGSLTLLLSMCEGYDPEILRSMAAKTPSSVIVDRIIRFTKKIYLKELIESKKFEGLALKKIKGEADSEAKNSLSTSGITNVSADGQNSAPPSISAKNSQSIINQARNDQIKAGVEIIQKCLKEQDLENKKYSITEEMEAMVEIYDWEELYDLYMERAEFSESRQFHYIFKIMILWQNLSKNSKTHKSRYEDAKYETDQYFKESNFLDFGFGGAGSDEKESGADKTQNKKETPPEFCSIFYFISNQIMIEVEVLDPEGTSVKVYFPKAPPCYMLSEQAKKAYRDECEITDSNTKMLNLMRNYRLFYILMTQDLQTWRTMGLLFKGLSADAFKGYTFFCWLLGVIINIIMAISIKMDEAGENLEYRSDTHKLITRILGYILVGISAAFLLIWMIFKYKQTYLTRFEDYIFDHPGASRSSFAAKFRVAVFSSFVSQSFPMNYTMHILFTVLGLEVSVFILSLNLMLIVNISKTTKFVLTSITLHADQLIQTLILAFFVIYAYSMIMGNNLKDQINPDLNAPCDSLIECFFFTINLGLRNGGGIAESLSDVMKDDKFSMRSVFDVTFFMLINVISLNIVFGIIIDTFSQLRDSQNERGTSIVRQRSI